MTHNGWTNYNTWLIHRWFFSDKDKHHFTQTHDVDALADELWCEVDGYIDENTLTMLTYDWSLEALHDVNWKEIAETII